jgi:hypothetical protein
MLTPLINTGKVCVFDPAKVRCCRDGRVYPCTDGFDESLGATPSTLDMSLFQVLELLSALSDFTQTIE